MEGFSLKGCLIGGRHYTQAAVTTLIAVSLPFKIVPCGLQVVIRIFNGGMIRSST